MSDLPRAIMTPDRQRGLAQDMLLGQHSVSYTVECSGLPEAQVEALARKLHAAKRIPRVRA